MNLWVVPPRGQHFTVVSTWLAVYVWSLYRGAVLSLFLEGVCWDDASERLTEVKVLDLMSSGALMAAEPGLGKLENDVRWAWCHHLPALPEALLLYTASPRVPSPAVPRSVRACPQLVIRKTFQEHWFLTSCGSGGGGHRSF